jgi:hypothetical protein
MMRLIIEAFPAKKTDVVMIERPGQRTIKKEMKHAEWVKVAMALQALAGYGFCRETLLGRYIFDI